MNWNRVLELFLGLPMSTWVIGLLGFLIVVLILLVWRQNRALYGLSTRVVRTNEKAFDHLARELSNLTGYLHDLAGGDAKEDEA